jgi:hypothetical protein
MGNKGITLMAWPICVGDPTLKWQKLLLRRVVGLGHPLLSGFTMLLWLLLLD